MGKTFLHCGLFAIMLLAGGTTGCGIGARAMGG